MEQLEHHARSIRQLIENKDYDALERYIVENKQAWHQKEYLLTNENTPINIALEAKDEKAIKLIIEHKADDFARSHPDSLSSAERLYLAQFYNEKNDTNFSKRYAIANCGMSKGVLEEIQFWHERGLLLGFFDSKHTDPLFLCCKSGYNDCVEYLVTEAGCDVNREKLYGFGYFTPLKAALCYGQIATAELLVKLGANVHQLISQQIPVDVHTNIVIQTSLIHHLCESVPSLQNEFENRVVAMKWALEQGIDYDKNCPVSDDYNYDNLSRAPALVFACRSTSPELAEVLIDHQKDKFVNNGGPLLESIACVKFPMFYSDSLVPLVQLLLPLVDPQKKDEHFANALAAAIYHFRAQYEQYLKDELGADIRLFSKKEKYSISKCRYFSVRLKLMGDGIDILTEQNEAKNYKLVRVDIPTRTAKLDSIRKKMKSISHSDEIYFEMQAKLSDPKHKDIWKHIHFNSDQHWKRPPRTQILLVDQKTNKIYKGIPEVQELVLSKLDPHIYVGVNFSDYERFFAQYAVFALTTPEDEANLILPKGYRIIYKQNANETEKSDPTATYNFGTTNNRPSLNNNNDDEQEDDSKKSRRSTRAAKRKLDEQSVIEEQPVETKRRKTRK